MTNTNATATKHTAANTPFLAQIKKEWNAKVYRRVLHAYNAGGERAAIEELAKFSMTYAALIA